MANLVGQVGCVTGMLAIIIIGIAFGAGWFIDDLMGNERRFVTMFFMLGSFPITLFAMVRISLMMVQRAQSRVNALQKNSNDSEKEESQA
ncbi:MAG: hypothetical protein DWQ04_35045 [Chloroflexi bacterium]|nr:MAG: hypothetical protein DWQ04_35045 [Chloroflexota bacterium]